MRVIVHVRTRARLEKVEKVEDGVYRAWVSAVPEKGKANDALISLLAGHFGTARSNVRIVLGKTSREKLIEVLGVGV